MAPISSLLGTPYLISDEPGATDRAAGTLRSAAELRQKARTAQSRLMLESQLVLEPFEKALRSEMVAESNRIEGNDWSTHEVRRIITEYKLELSSPDRRFLDALKGDAHTYEVIGLYAAHQLAEQLARSEGPLRETDIRQLHAVIVGNAHFAGRYKTAENMIGGTTQRRTAPWDVPRAVDELCRWWAASDADPLLQAAIVHAWLSDIHPFEDGNGRVARILANYALIKADYPPLILRSQSDRGQYYDALACSDDGDILPLLELFVRTIARTVKMMASPDYTRQVIEDKLLANDSQRFQLWGALLGAFRERLESALAEAGAHVQYQGCPGMESFSLLADHDSDGNSWFLKIGDGRHWELLCWFGYESNKMRDLVREDQAYPSIYFSVRDRAEQAIHPWAPIGERDYLDLPNEVRLLPASTEPVQLRWNNKLEPFDLQQGVGHIVRSVCKYLQLPQPAVADPL